MPFITQGKTNIKYILIIVILAAIVGGGILGYQYWWAEKQETTPPEIKLPEKVATLEINLKTTKLATIPEKYNEVSDFIFTQDGRQVAYKARQGAEWFVVIGEEEGKHYEDVRDLVFSLDGQQLAYVAEKEGRFFVVVNKKELTSYDSQSYYGPSDIVLSPDGKQLAYIIKERIGNSIGKESVVFNGKEGKFYDVAGEPKFYGEPSITLSPSSKNLAYRAAIFGKGELVVLNGEEGKEYDRVECLLFSSNDEHFAYSAEEKGKCLLVIDGNENTELCGCPFAFSPDSNYLVLGGGIDIYDLKTGKTVAKPEFEFGSQSTHSSYYSCTFSPDDQQLACNMEAQWGESVELNGKSTKSYSRVSFPVFSPDSKHLTYTASEFGDNPKEFIVVDGKEKIIDGQISGPSLYFGPDSKSLVYGVKKGNELWWIEEEVK